MIQNSLIYLFAIKNVVGSCEDGVDGSGVFEEHETEAAALLGHCVDLERI